MMLVLSISAYACLLCFVLGCILRAAQYARTPKHLRWELYPVPHEPAHRSSHGGSQYEVSEWWTHPGTKSQFGAVRAMLDEIVTLRTVRLANRDLWWRSQLFHAGMYCSVLAALILGFSGMSFVTWLPLKVVATVGRAGLLLMFLGSCALLWKRMRDPDLVNSTHIAGFIQLGAIAVGAVLVLTGSLSASAPSAVSLTRALVTGQSIHVPLSLAFGVLIAGGIVAYIPYSQMAHFIGKYFAYHQVLWDDEQLRGSKLVVSLARNVEYCPTWSAPHVSGDGVRTWGDIARHDPASMSGAGK